MSLIFELIQGYGGMHHWVKYCVNRCMKSEVIALTNFVTDGRTPSISMPWRGTIMSHVGSWCTYFYCGGNVYTPVKIFIPDLNISTSVLICVPRCKYFNPVEIFQPGCKYFYPWWKYLYPSSPV